jgi:DNA-directed RNA polymerase subunit RPC12/RpoP
MREWMPMPSRKYTCAKCQRRFSATDTNGSGIRDYENIDCPYCGHINGRIKTAGVVLTEKVDPE